MLLALRIKSIIINAFKGHLYYVKNTSLKYFIEINVLPSLLFNKLPCTIEIKLVAVFVFSVVVIVLLNCVVCQMDEWLVNAFLTKCKLVRTCSDVTFFKQVAFLIFQIATIDEDHKSDIKFTFVN